MKRYKSTDLLDQLQSDVRALLVIVNYLRVEDPGHLLEPPGPGKWSVIQVLDHLNNYGRYYLPAIEKSLQKDNPAVEWFKPGWAGNYFTKLLAPGEEGKVKNRLKSPRNYRPAPFLDPFTVINTFVQQQQQLLDLLEKAKSCNIGAVRTPISLTRLIRLKVGDTFRFLIAHEQRHFIQLKNALDVVKEGHRLGIAV